MLGTRHGMCCSDGGLAGVRASCASCMVSAMSGACCKTRLAGRLAKGGERGRVGGATCGNRAHSPANRQHLMNRLRAFTHRGVAVSQQANAVLQTDLTDALALGGSDRPVRHQGSWSSRAPSGRRLRSRSLGFLLGSAACKRGSDKLGSGGCSTGGKGFASFHEQRMP